MRQASLQPWLTRSGPGERPGSRFRSPAVRYSEFAHPACLDSIARLPSGRDHSVHIPDHEHFRRDRPQHAGDGPRPVRAGSGLALGF
jgi:hypothetical protein